MSSIVLSASVRQNLLSLQSTADLLSTTQSRLSTGKKVNSAVDNPTNFFTALSLDNRASDINNLLDGIGNGVQALQSANTGITSLQKLVDTAKSIGNQVLQTAVGYSSKSAVTSAAIAGATASNLLGTGGFSDATFTGAAAVDQSSNPITVNTVLGGVGGPNQISPGGGFLAGDIITVNGQTLNVVGSGASGANQINYTDTVGTLLAKIDALSGGSGSTVSSGQLVLHTGTTSDLTITTSYGNGFIALGIPGGVNQARGGSAGGISGQTLSIASTGGGTATNITFGTGANQVDTLDELNASLVSNNLQASIDKTGRITLTTTNDAASSMIGTIAGTAAGAGQPFNGLTISSPVADAASQAQRANLVKQYNDVISQINATAADSSYNGINLLGGDTLKLTFNETGKSRLDITGANFNATGLGLSMLTGGTDFLDNISVSRVITTLGNASSALRSQASALGSNLSIVQIRQDFSKNLINVLQTGSSNLTLADTNEEAANSQALSTRQSIAVSALALANQSQQSVLQLLR